MPFSPPLGGDLSRHLVTPVVLTKAEAVGDDGWPISQFHQETEKEKNPYNPEILSKHQINQIDQTDQINETNQKWKDNETWNYTIE